VIEKVSKGKDAIIKGNMFTVEDLKKGIKKW
jgi:hypothetical protein